MGMGKYFFLKVNWENVQVFIKIFIRDKIIIFFFVRMISLMLWVYIYWGWNGLVGSRASAQYLWSFIGCIYIYIQLHPHPSPLQGHSGHHQNYSLYNYTEKELKREELTQEQLCIYKKKMWYRMKINIWFYILDTITQYT